MKTKVNELKNTIWTARVKLLDMEYKTSELADELGVTPKYIRHTLAERNGMPCRKSDNGMLWFNGAEVRRWIEANYIPRNRRKRADDPMKENEFYCVKCRERRISETYTVIADRGTVYKKAYCPICGTRMNKYLPKKGE